MPARGFVSRCSRVVLLSRVDGALSVVVDVVRLRPFWPPSGRSHRASLLGCHASVRSSLSRVAALGARFAGGLHWLHWSQLAAAMA